MRISLSEYTSNKPGSSMSNRVDATFEVNPVVDPTESGLKLYKEATNPTS